MTGVKVGDWVRFYHANGLVIAVVEYIEPRASWERSDKACTDRGKVSIDQILEVRKAVDAVARSVESAHADPAR